MAKVGKFHLRHKNGKNSIRDFPINKMHEALHNRSFCSTYIISRSTETGKMTKEWQRNGAIWYIRRDTETHFIRQARLSFEHIERYTQNWRDNLDTLNDIPIQNWKYVEGLANSLFIPIWKKIHFKTCEQLRTVSLMKHKLKPYLRKLRKWNIEMVFFFLHHITY